MSHFIKQLPQTFKVLWSSNLFKALLLIILMLLTIRIVNFCFDYFKKKNNLHTNFLKGVLQALIIIFFLIQIGSLSDAMASFYNSILMSSSLLVVVLGFVFQEGLSNIVHGFILTFFKPFDIGDRVNVTIDGVQITDNSYFDENSVNSNFLDIEITYESDLDHACEVFSQIIDSHPLVKAAKKPQAEPTKILVSQLGASGITLRASVVTATIEENFTACSDIRKELIHHFHEDPALDFAYPHTVVVPYTSES